MAVFVVLVFLVVFLGGVGRLPGGVISDFSLSVTQ